MSLNETLLFSHRDINVFQDGKQETFMKKTDDRQTEGNQNEVCLTGNISPQFLQRQASANASRRMSSLLARHLTASAADG